jgi:hypothetical protein
MWPRPERSSQEVISPWGISAPLQQFNAAALRRLYDVLPDLRISNACDVIRMFAENRQPARGAPVYVEGAVLIHLRTQLLKSSAPAVG